MNNRYLNQAFTDNGVVELRHQVGDKWTTGWFNNVDDLLRCARERYREGNLFLSLNRPAPRQVLNRMAGVPITNGDVQFLTRLFFDFDPVRPTGCPSTEDELLHAVKTAREAQKVFKCMGWPDPVVAISGNGAHLIYRTHLANTAETRDMLTVVYNGLRTDYSSDHVQFDRAVRNPGRIAPLYGSIKRKGDNTPDRPHRRSEILFYPRDWQQVQRRSLDGVANFYASQQPVNVPGAGKFEPTSHRWEHGAGDYTSLDIVAWFTAHGLYEHPIAGVIHAVRCPWEDEHSTSQRNDTTIFVNEDGTWPGFHCKHDHCTGRGIRDVMEVMGDADHFCSKRFQPRKPPCTNSDPINKT